MRTYLLLAAALAAIGVNADDSSTSTTLPYFYPSWSVSMPTHGRGIGKTAASLAKVEYQTTTYHVGCQKNVDKGECSFPHSWTIIQGPDTANFKGEYVATTSEPSTSVDVTITQTYDCSLHSSTGSASCSMSVSMSGSLNGAKYKSSSSTKQEYKSAPFGTTGSYNALLVTAGLSSTTNSKATETGAAATGNAGPMITAAPMVVAAVAAML